MRVLMGEVIDVNSDLTTKNLNLRQKAQVLWQSMIADSKLLGNKKRQEEEKALKARNERIDRLRDGVLASLDFHLMSNRTLAEFNEEAEVVQFAIEREHADIVTEVLSSHEFNGYDVEEVFLDPDIVNSFGSIIPIIYAFRQKEV